MTDSSTSMHRGTVVLVHGTWSSPMDWRFVERYLHAAGVRTIAPDLPSHRRYDHGIIEDAAEVKQAIRAAAAPVVLVGWSYGGAPITLASADEPAVRRLVYLGSRPDWDDDVAARDDEWAHLLESHPHIRTWDDGSSLIDDHWFTTEEEGATFPPEVRAAWQPRRRAASAPWGATEVPRVWERIPSTIIVGRKEGWSDEELARCAERIPDTRIWETDHFPLFREPERVAAAIVELLDAAAAESDASAVGG